MRVSIIILFWLLLAGIPSLVNGQSTTNEKDADQLIGRALSTYELDRFDSTIYFAQRAIILYKESGNQRAVIHARAHLIDAIFEKEEFSQGYRHLDSLLKDINQIRDTSLAGVYFALKGRALFFQNKLDSAKEILTKSTSYHPPAPLTYFIAEAFNDLGYCWVKLGREDKMIEYGQQAYELYQSVKSDFGCARALSNMAISYRILGKETKAIEISTKALGFRFKLGNFQTIALGCCNLAQEYAYQNLDSAKRYQRLCVEYANRSGNNTRKGNALRTSALIFSEMKQFDSAFKYSNQSIELLEKYGIDQWSLATNYISAAFYAEKANKDSTQVLGLFDKALTLGKKLADKSTIRNGYLYRSGYYQRQRKFQQAFEDFSRSVAYKDSIGLEKQQKNLDELEAKYQTAKKEAAIELLNVRKKTDELLLVQQKSVAAASKLQTVQKNATLSLLQKEGELQSLEIERQQQLIKKQALEAESREKKLRLQRQQQLLSEAMLLSESRKRNTIWAGGIASLIIAGILFSWFRVRQQIKQERMMEEVRGLIAKDLHDDIGAALSNINILNELSLRHSDDPIRVEGFLSKSAEDIRRVNEGVSDIVWNINPRYDSLEHLFVRMKRYAADVFDAMNINYKFNFPETVNKKVLDMNRRRDFYLLFKEAVNDLARFSGAQQASIQLKVDEHLIGILIEDDRPVNAILSAKQQTDATVLKEKASKYKVGFELEKNVGLGTRMFLSIVV